MPVESMPDPDLSDAKRQGPRPDPKTSAPRKTEFAERLERQLDGLEDRLVDLHKQVQRLQRMASLGTISAILAHEFNNLLTPMLTYCQYALSRDDPDLIKTAVEKSHKNAKRLSMLCGKILGMASDQQMGPGDTRVKPLLCDAVECVGRDFEKDRIQVTIDAPDGLTASAHAGHLQQVLFNLVLNARQAMLDQPGRLSLRARRMDAGGVEITVADTGCGIRPDHLDRIFEPFFSTRDHERTSDRRGIGLGLHICRQLMEEQDGTITVESRPGHGATFTLTLPAGLSA